MDLAVIAKPMMIHVLRWARRLVAVLSIVAAGLTGGVAGANQVPIAGGGNDWQSVTGFTLNGNGTPYFDGTSSDGSTPGNVWNLLVTQGGIANANLTFWGTASGGADPDITFGQGTDTLTLKFEFAGNANVNEFGWFRADLGGNGFDAGDLHPLFTGPQTPGATTTVTIPAAFGLYLKNTATGAIYLSLSDSNPVAGDVGDQHFAVFRDVTAPQTMWLGMEDLPFGKSDNDFQDMIVTMSAVPEPSTLVLLLGTGLVTLGFGARRRLVTRPG